MTPGGGRETRIIRCPACQRYYRVPGAPPAPGVRLRCSKCGNVFTVEPESRGAADPKGGAAAKQQADSLAAKSHRVLVATDGAEFQALVGEVLAVAGFALQQALSGEEAWEAIGSWRPHVAVLDVALPGIPSFELCDRIRADTGLRNTGLILIASVFQQTRYKRAPTSLYGADDYIEKHHIRDRLPEKVSRLLPAAAVVPAAPKGPAAPPPRILDTREQETLICEELYGSLDRAGTPPESPGESLRRYARIIISDIALYNQELVERGIREGTFCELLKKELGEGHKLYLTRVPPSVQGPDHYQQAVEEFIARRTVASGGKLRAGGEP